MRASVLIVVGVMALVAVAWLLQHRLIYLPWGRVGSPAEVGLPRAEEVTLVTGDGLRLGAWYVPATGETVGAVLVLPGNAGNRSLRAPLARRLSGLGLAALLVDYRGFGGNPGRPSEAGLLRDAAAGRAFLAQRAEVDDDAIVYFGESLGAAVAVGLAGSEPPRGLILRSPFTSLAEIAQYHYRVPVGPLLRDRFDVVAGVARYQGPVLVLAGANDTIVPPGHSRRVAEAAADGRYVMIAGADHNDPALLAGDALVAAVTGFLRDIGLDVPPP